MKDAHTILGVRKDANRNEIARRYEVILKKYRVGASSGEDTGIDINEVNRAYNLLMGYDTGESDKAQNNKPTNPILQKFNIDEKKVRNFFYYYKVHMIVSVVIIALLVYIIRTIVFTVTPDINIVFIGQFYDSHTEVLEKRLTSNLPGVKAVSIIVIPLLEGVGDQQEYALQMKAMAVLSAGDVDLCITDKANFDKYAKQNAFTSLDNIADELKIDKAKNKDYMLTLEEAKTEHLYGLDIGSSKILGESEIMGNEKIASIMVRSPHYDNAVKLIKLLMQ